MFVIFSNFKQCLSRSWTISESVCVCAPTCMTALNQQVLPTFFSPTGQFSILFLSCGLGESLQTSVWVRFRLALFSAMLASKTLSNKQAKQNLFSTK